MPPIILASQSPRRKEILNYFTLPFEQFSPNFDESSIPFRDDPDAYVTSIASAKAYSLKESHPDAIIIAADTIVYYNHKVYGKPRDEQDAYKSLSELSGRWHSVFTGVAVLKDDEVFAEAEETRVSFNELSHDQIKKYHSYGHGVDKAGGYGIQMGGGLIVKEIDGCYYNVMGLPMNTLRHLLQKVNIELWDYLG